MNSLEVAGQCPYCSQASATSDHLKRCSACKLEEKQSMKISVEPYVLYAAFEYMLNQCALRLHPTEWFIQCIIDNWDALKLSQDNICDSIKTAYTRERLIAGAVLEDCDRDRELNQWYAKRWIAEVFPSWERILHRAGTSVNEPSVYMRSLGLDRR